jgi:hypothetical protein
VTTLNSVDSVLMVADIARTLNDFRPPGETLERICERVTGLSGYDSTGVFMPDPDGRQLVLRGSWGLSPAYIDYINRDHPILLDDTRQLGLAPAAEAYRSGHPVTLADTDLEASFQPWKPGARLQGYRSLACIPVIVRSQAIGVLVCYGRAPRRHPGEEIELLQLVAWLAGVAIETARVAEWQRRSVEELRELSEQLGRQNEELSRLSAMQLRLTQTLADPDATTLERTAQTLAELTARSVLVSAPSGHTVVYVGRREERNTMAVVAGRRELARLLRQEAMVNIDGHTCLRVGVEEMPLGVIVLRPDLGDKSGTAALVASHAAALMAAELYSERADLALQMHARPAVLLALTHGLYPQALLREAAGVLGIPVDAQLRLALFRCSTVESAHRLSRRISTIRGAGWPAIAATTDGHDTLVLLDLVDPSRLRRAGTELRQAALEIQAIGVSSALNGLESLGSGRHQGQAAATIDGGTSASLFEDLGVFGELARDLPPGRADVWVEKMLGRLRAYDRARGARLVETLAIFVRHQGRVKLVAAELGVHSNTVLQRVRRCAELGGFDLRDFRDVARVVLALEWDRMLHPQAAGANASGEVEGGTRSSGAIE